MLNIEFQITSAKLLRLVPHVNPPTNTTTTLTAADILGSPKIRWTSDGYKYDEVRFHTANDMFAPNLGSPTGVTLCSDAKYWEARLYAASGPQNAIVPDFIHGSSLVGGVMAGIQIGFSLGGLFTIALTCVGGTMTHDDGTPLAWVGFALDAQSYNNQPVWDRILFGFLNNFNLNEFKVRLNHGKNGVGGYWITTNLVNNATKGVNVPWDLKLPNHPDAQPGLWTKVGTPDQIDEVQFLMIGDDILSMHGGGVVAPSVMSYLHFRREPRANTVGTAAWGRQNIVIDRTLDDQADVQVACESEAERVRYAELFGSVTVKGSLLYANSKSGNANHMLLNPGDGIELDIPAWGLNGVIRRVDHIQHVAIGGKWLAIIHYGPFMSTDILDLYRLRLDLLMDTGDEEPIE